MKSKNQLGQSTFILKLVIWLFSVVTSFLIGWGFFYIGINTVGYIYELKHPIPPGEDDLGIGFVAMLYAPIIFVIAVILSLLLIKFFKRIFSKLLGVIHE